MSPNVTTLKQALQNEAFVITAEISPPLSAGPTELEAKIDLLKGSVHAVNVSLLPLVSLTHTLTLLLSSQHHP